MKIDITMNLLDFDDDFELLKHFFFFYFLLIDILFTSIQPIF